MPGWQDGIMRFEWLMVNWGASVWRETSTEINRFGVHQSKKSYRYRCIPLSMMRLGGRQFFEWWSGGLFSSDGGSCVAELSTTDICRWCAPSADEVALREISEWGTPFTESANRLVSMTTRHPLLRLLYHTSCHLLVAPNCMRKHVKRLSGGGVVVVEII